jgi:tRNA pseudouridine38-40 synthase
MPRYKILIEYDGTAFFGWQSQLNLPSVQETIENAIEKFCQQKIRVFAAGRTDTGVHATGQVAHFDLDKQYPTQTIVNAINFYLRPSPVAIMAAEIVTDEFHARFSAKKRYYKYIIINRLAPLIINNNRAWQVKESLDIKKMQEASKCLIGQHDFSSFRALACQANSPVKSLDELRIIKEEDNIIFYLSAPSFLHHMVRNIVGTLKLVGNGNWQIEDVKAALDAKDRTKGGPKAPAYGLYLYQVDY